MVLTRLIIAALMALALFVFAPAANAGLTAATMYEPDTVVAIELGLSPEAEAEMEAEPDEYVEATFALHETDGTPGGVLPQPLEPPITVGLRPKGSAGSGRDLSGKTAFKIKFDKFVDDQTFLGLEKLTLNNMVQDPSMLHETLTYDAFRAVGVAAPRTGYAYVYLNDRDYGMHLNVETLDKIGLEKRFGEFDDPQHLYEGGPNMDVLPGSEANFEIDEGDEADISDLERLIEVTAEPAPSFSERMPPVADLGQMVRMWAGERYLAQVDGYTGPNVNNYYLYSDADGKFQMFPWGTDQSLFASDWEFTPDHSGTLFALCLDDGDCLSDYEKALLAVWRVSQERDLVAQGEALAALLAPWQELELAQQPPRYEHDAAQISAAVSETLAFLEDRPAALAQFLGEELPELPADPGQPEEPEGPEPIGDPGPADDLQDRAQTGPRRSAPSSTDPAEIGPPQIAIDRDALDSGVLALHAHFDRRGTVAVRGTFGPRGERRRACRVGPRRVGAAANVVLRCRLTAVTRERLSARFLKLRLVVRFHPAGGATRTVTRTVRLPRQAHRHAIKRQVGGTGLEPVTPSL